MRSLLYEFCTVLYLETSVDAAPEICVCVFGYRRLKTWTKTDKLYLSDVNSKVYSVQICTGE